MMTLFRSVLSCWHIVWQLCSTLVFGGSKKSFEHCKKKIKHNILVKNVLCLRSLSVGLILHNVLSLIPPKIAVNQKHKEPHHKLEVNKHQKNKS